MTLTSMLARAALFTLALALSSQPAAADTSSVVRLDPALDELVSADAHTESLITGDPGDSYEGPVWIRKPAPGYLLFTNVPANAIKKWTPDGKVSVYLGHIFNGDPSTALHAGPRLMPGANGAALDRQGRLVFTSYSAGEIVRLEKSGKRTVLAREFDGKRINAPNDVVVRSDGVVYFTDSRMATPETTGPDCGKFWLVCGNATGIPHKGVYFIKSGKVHLFTEDVDHPNGVVFSPDEKYLYVSNTLQKNILRFERKSDGTGTNETVFADMSGDKAQGQPDGIKVDVRGNVYCTGPGGIWILSSTGQHLGTILMSERATNFAFGDEDGKTLYLEGATSLVRIRVKVAGDGLRP